MHSGVRWLFIVGLLVVVFWTGRWTAPSPESIVRVDTVTIVQPPIIRHTTDTIYVTRTKEINIYDTVYIDRLVEESNAIVAVSEERCTYGDSTYYAVVSGPVVAGLHPRLDSISVYNRTIERVVERKPRWGLSVGPFVGADLRGKPVVGVGCSIGFLVWTNKGAR